MTGVQLGQVQIVDYLISKGSNVNATMAEFDSNSALHYAAERNFESIVQVLVKSGANLNAKNEMLETPLFSAARRDNMKVLQVLVEGGTDLTIENKDGKTVVQVAGPNARKYLGQLCEVSAKNEYEKPPQQPILTGTAEVTAPKESTVRNAELLTWLEGIGLQSLHVGLLKAGLAKAAIALYESKEELYDELTRSGFPEITVAQAGTLFRASRK